MRRGILIFGIILAFFHVGIGQPNFDRHLVGDGIYAFRRCCFRIGTTYYARCTIWLVDSVHSYDRRIRLFCGHLSPYVPWVDLWILQKAARIIVANWYVHLFCVVD